MACQTTRSEVNDNRTFNGHYGHNALSPSKDFPMKLFQRFLHGEQTNMQTDQADRNLVLMSHITWRKVIKVISDQQPVGNGSCIKLGDFLSHGHSHFIHWETNVYQLCERIEVLEHFTEHIICTKIVPFKEYDFYGYRIWHNISINIVKMVTCTR